MMLNFRRQDPCRAQGMGRKRRKQRCKVEEVGKLLFYLSSHAVSRADILPIHVEWLTTSKMLQVCSRVELRSCAIAMLIHTMLRTALLNKGVRSVSLNAQLFVHHDKRVCKPSFEVLLCHKSSVGPLLSLRVLCNV